MRSGTVLIPFTSYGIDITKYLDTKDLTQFSFQQLRIGEIDYVENGIQKTYKDIATTFEPFQVQALFSEIEIPGKYFLRVVIKQPSILSDDTMVDRHTFVGEIDIKSGMMNLKKFKSSEHDKSIEFIGYRLKVMVDKNHFSLDQEPS